MQKLLAIAGMVMTISGTAAPFVAGFSPKYAALIVAAGLTAQAVTKPVVDVTTIWRKALGQEQAKAKQ